MTSSEAATRRPVHGLGSGEGGRPFSGKRFDAVNVGAGAAGPSLARQLAHSGGGRDVLLIDDGSHPIDQRPWAWWTTGHGLLDSAAIATCLAHGRSSAHASPTRRWNRALDNALVSIIRDTCEHDAVAGAVSP